MNQHYDEIRCRLIENQDRLLDTCFQAAFDIDESVIWGAFFMNAPGHNRNLLIKERITSLLDRWVQDNHFIGDVARYNIAEVSDEALIEAAVNLFVQTVVIQRIIAVNRALIRPGQRLADCPIKYVHSGIIRIESAKDEDIPIGTRLQQHQIALIATDHLARPWYAMGFPKIRNIFRVPCKSNGDLLNALNVIGDRLHDEFFNEWKLPSKHDRLSYAFFLVRAFFTDERGCRSTYFGGHFTPELDNIPLAPGVENRTFSSECGFIVQKGDSLLILDCGSRDDIDISSMVTL